MMRVQVALAPGEEGKFVFFFFHTKKCFPFRRGGGEGSRVVVCGVTRQREKV